MVLTFHTSLLSGKQVNLILNIIIAVHNTVINEV
jgi:hypothetical protein